MKEDISKQLEFYNKVEDESGRMLKRTLPLHKMMKHLCKRNRWLQTERRRLQRQVKALETQIEMIQAELLKKGLKIIAKIDGTP